MTLVGFAGLLLALSAAYLADIRSSRLRLVVFSLLLVMHTLASIAYYFFAEASGSDAHLYYYDVMRVYGQVQGLGTIFMINAVQLFKQNLGGSFFDYFLVFQAIGFWGVVFLMKTIQEIREEVGVHDSGWAYLPLFLPGIHFWPSAIGKDAPLFLGVALAIWSCMNLSKRLFGMGAAVVIMLAVRPHVAMIALIALGIAALIEKKMKLWVKALLVMGIVGGSITVTSSMESTYRVDVTSANSVSDFMAARNQIGEDSGVDMSIVEGNPFMKVFTLWLRPMFLDAENLMGYVASTENLALLLIFAVVLANFGLARTLFWRVLYCRFSVLFFLLLTGLLAAVNFNIGLGLRQKMMAVPCLLALFSTVIAVKMAQRNLAREVVQPGAGLVAGRA